MRAVSHCYGALKSSSKCSLANVKLSRSVLVSINGCVIVLAMSNEGDEMQHLPKESAGVQ